MNQHNRPRLTDRSRILPGERVLTANDIRRLGLEQAPDDLGPSWEELEHAKQRQEANRG